MYKTYCTKYRTHISKLLRKYSINGIFGVRYTNKKGLKTYRLFYNEGFKRKEEPIYGKVDNIPNSKIHLARTSLISRLQAGKCEYCGATDKPIEMHHVKKLKDLKGKDYWEQLMIARNRKTLAVCHDCHRKIHYGKMD
jgi:hypothetical protein